MELDEETRIMAKGAAWQNAANILTKLLAFIYTIIIARFVPQEEVGLFYFGLGIVGLVTILADLGFSGAVVRYVPYYLGRKDADAAARTVSLTVIVGVALLAIGSASVFLLSGSIAQFFSNPRLGPVLEILAVQLAVTQAYLIASSILTALKKIRETGLASISQALLKLAFTFVLIFSLGADAKSLAAALMLSYVLGAFYLLWELSRHLGWMRRAGGFVLSEHWKALGEMTPFGIMLVGVLLFGTVISSSDRIMIGYFMGDRANDQIAVYSIATGLAGLVALFAGSIFAIFFPLVSELVGKGDLETVNRTSQTALKWMLFSSIPMVAFLVAFGAPMLRVLYGAAYEPGSVALSLYAVGLFAAYFGAAQRTVLAGMRLIRVELLAVIVAALVNLALNYLLIPPFGINGSAFSSMVACFVMTWMNQYYAKKYFGFEIPKSAWMNIACGFAVLASLQLISSAMHESFVRLPLGFGDGTIVGAVLDKFAKLAVMSVFFALGCGIYLVLLNLMRLFEGEDAKVFQGILHKFGMPHWINAFATRVVFWNQKEIY